MQMPDFECGEFTSLVAEKSYKKALQTVMGVGDKAVVYARALINCIEELTPNDRESLLAWCNSPMEDQPIGELQWYLDQIARHEVGHAVVARVLGFKTGAISLMLKAANGDHTACATTPLYTSTPNSADVESYIERRIMVLIAGTMSEAASIQQLKYEFWNAWNEPQPSPIGKRLRNSFKCW
jgi:prephenate dehydrogenase